MPHTARDVSLMRRALELAANGPERGVNPRVGCVVADADGAVLSEGWHRGAGTAHAEVDALSRLAPSAVRGATVYVTLEPCNHTGRTGPCVDALLSGGVARVVYGASDPGEASSGGARRLAASGVEVTGGVLAAEVERFLGDWILTARLGRPLVTVKWASSLDGRAAAVDGTSRWITGPAARSDVHALRSRNDAIAVGTGTLIADDPALTARADDGSLLERQPVPVVLGRRAVPEDAAVRRHPRDLVALTGADLRSDLRELHGLGIRSLLVEGGPALASSFLAAGLADELVVYIAPSLLGGDRLAIRDIGVATITEARRLDLTDLVRLGGDVRLTLRPVHATSAKGVD